MGKPKKAASKGDAGAKAQDAIESGTLTVSVKSVLPKNAGEVEIVTTHPDGFTKKYAVSKDFTPAQALPVIAENVKSRFGVAGVEFSGDLPENLAELTGADLDFTITEKKADEEGEEEQEEEE